MPGTAIYDINGHVGIVYDVTPDGRILYMDAHPDETVSRSSYGPQFGQSVARLGGGFKNFRPLKLVGARLKNGAYVGGHMVLARNKDIADFSMEQYRGTGPGAKGDGPDARFAYNNAALGLFEYARASMSAGNFAFNPAYELQVSMQALCHEVRERAIHVNDAKANGIPDRPQIARIPGTAAQNDNAEWASYATLPADARLKEQFHAVLSGCRPDDPAIAAARYPPGAGQGCAQGPSAGSLCGGRARLRHHLYQQR